MSKVLLPSTNKGLEAAPGNGEEISVEADPGNGEEISVEADAGNAEEILILFPSKVQLNDWERKITEYWRACVKELSFERIILF